MGFGPLLNSLRQHPIRTSCNNITYHAHPAHAGVSKDDLVQKGLHYKPASKDVQKELKSAIVSGWTDKDTNYIRQLKNMAIPSAPIGDWVRFSFEF